MKKRFVCHKDYRMDEDSGGGIAFAEGEEYEFTWDEDAWLCLEDAQGDEHWMDETDLSTEHFFLLVEEAE